MRKFCLLPSYIMKLYVNECSMFITTVHLLISWNLLRELQTSIHALLAQQRHNSIAFSTLGLKCKKSLFVRWCQSLEWETQWILKFVKEILQKRNKKSSSQYSRNWRFLYGAWWDNAKIQTQQNWIKLNHFFNIFRTLRNAGTFSPLQSTSAIFLFSFFAYLFAFHVQKLFKSSILVNILWRIELQSNSITSFENDGGSSKRNFFLRDTQKANA